MKYQANPVIVDAFVIQRIFVQTACAETVSVICGGQQVNVICGEPESKHTPERAKGDVGMDHVYVKGSWDAEGLGLLLDDGRIVVAAPEMTARMMPAVGDYWVVQSDGYVYLNPKQVFERKYSAREEIPLDPQREANPLRMLIAITRNNFGHQTTLASKEAWRGTPVVEVSLKWKDLDLPFEEFSPRFLAHSIQCVVNKTKHDEAMEKRAEPVYEYCDKPLANSIGCGRLKGHGGDCKSIAPFSPQP